MAVSHLSRALFSVAIASCVASGVLPWHSSGVGSAMRPYELAALLLSGSLPTSTPAGLGIIPLLPVAAAAVLVGLSGMPRLRRTSGLIALVLCLPPTASLLITGNSAVAAGGYALAAAVLTNAGLAALRSPADTGRLG